MVSVALARHVSVSTNTQDACFGCCQGSAGLHCAAGSLVRAPDECHLNRAQCRCGYRVSTIDSAASVWQGHASSSAALCQRQAAVCARPAFPCRSQSRGGLHDPGTGAAGASVPCVRDIDIVVGFWRCSSSMHAAAAACMQQQQHACNSSSMHAACMQQLSSGMHAAAAAACMQQQQQQQHGIAWVCW